jgi:hypothetical protein
MRGGLPGGRGCSRRRDKVRVMSEAKKAPRTREEHRRQVARQNLKRLADAWEKGGERAFDQEWEKLFAHRRLEVTDMKDYWPGGPPSDQPE